MKQMLEELGKDDNHFDKQSKLIVKLLTIWRERGYRLDPDRQADIVHQQQLLDRIFPINESLEASLDKALEAFETVRKI